MSCGRTCTTRTDAAEPKLRGGGPYRRHLVDLAHMGGGYRTLYCASKVARLGSSALAAELARRLPTLTSSWSYPDACSLRYESGRNVLSTMDINGLRLSRAGLLSSRAPRLK